MKASAPGPAAFEARLSRFAPLGRLLCYDDFDEGLHGWTGLIGNYEGSLDNILPDYADLRPPQLSNLSMWDTGTAGSMEGSYALKLATRPHPGSLAVAIKRHTFRRRGPVQFECYFSFKPEASQLQLSLQDVRAFGVLFDVQDDEKRWMPHLRYCNALEGRSVGCWQVKAQTRPLQQLGSSGQTRSHFHLGPEGWQEVPGGRQQLCYNEIATKMNWHYLRVGIDLERRCFTGFQCNDQVFAGEGLGVIEMPAMPNLYCMLNVALWVETDSHKRAFLYADSALLSAELED